MSKTAKKRGLKRVRGRVGKAAEAETKMVIGAPMPVSASVDNAGDQDKSRWRHRAHEALRLLPLNEVGAVLPVLEQYASTASAVPRDATEAHRRTLDFDKVVEAIDLCDSMICDQNYHHVTSCNPNDLACLIHNNGDPVDRVEAFLVLAPIAKRVSERMDRKIDERNARMRDASAKMIRESAAKKLMER